MLFLVMRRDQWPTIGDHMPVTLTQHSEFYPRIVQADDALSAIKNAFAPDRLRPNGTRRLIAVPMGEPVGFLIAPRKEYDITMDERVM